MTWRVPNYLSEALLSSAVLLGPLAFGAVEPWSLFLLCALLSATCLSCLGGRAPDFSQAVYRSILPGVLCLLALGALQRLNPRAILEPWTPLPSTASPYATGRALLVWGAYATALWCAPQILAGSTAVRRLASLVFGLGCVVALVGVVQATQGEEQLIYGFRLAPYPLDPFGPYYNRDHAASLLVMAMFCGGGLLWDQAVFWRDRERSVYDAAAIAGLILFGIGLNSFGLLITRSVGALAALIAAGFVVAALGAWPRTGRALCLGLILVLTAMAIPLTPVAHRVRNGVAVSLAQKLTVSHAKAAAADRLVLYHGAWRAFLDRPWLGSGLGAFQQTYYPYQPKSVDALVDHAHCDWLELLVEAGILGFSAYALGLFAFLASCAKSLSSPVKRTVRGLSLGLGGAILSFMIHGLVDFSFQIPANALVFFVLLAGLGTLARGGSPSSAPSRGALGYKANAAAALAALAVAMGAAPGVLASWHYLSVKQTSPASRAAGLAKAAELDGSPRYYSELAQHEASLAGEGPPKRANLEQALAHSQAALRQDPANPSLRDLQGRILWRLGRVADARELIEGN